MGFFQFSFSYGLCHYKISVALNFFFSFYATTILYFSIISFIVTALNSVMNISDKFSRANRYTVVEGGGMKKYNNPFLTWPNRELFHHSLVYIFLIASSCRRRSWLSNFIICELTWRLWKISGAISLATL